MTETAALIGLDEKEKDDLETKHESGRKHVGNMARVASQGEASTPDRKRQAYQFPYYPSPTG